MVAGLCGFECAGGPSSSWRFLCAAIVLGVQSTKMSVAGAGAAISSFGRLWSADLEIETFEVGFLAAQEIICLSSW